MASSPRTCTSCSIAREPAQFLSKTNQILKTCSICRDRRGRVYMKRKADDAQLDSNQHMEPSTLFRPCPTFLYRGQNSQDSPMRVEARKRRNLDRQAHCVARPCDEDIAPTQPLGDYLTTVRHENGINLNQGNFSIPQSSQIGPDSMPVSSQTFNSTPSTLGQPHSGRSIRSQNCFSLGFFICVSCEDARDYSRQAGVGVGYCQYCDPNSTTSKTQYKYCIFGGHEADIASFCDDTAFEHNICNSCRASATSPININSRFNSSASTPPSGQLQQASSPTGAHPIQGPESDFFMNQNLHRALADKCIEYCIKYPEKRFQMTLNRDGICGRCSRDRGQETPLFNVANNREACGSRNNRP